eukprot:CAMPEP_0198291824 /NCGR_PEP_ID=MMETSP1449-20131203/9213_1 /TAXON_ID=420275 /ORGANISM="Attheya septentrionalis, Strain CCMP2084" /LENGTH=492 /DNA_ID=CAMNT_0043990507 /DNA_START=105 /DNA_END=1583 /DNA_ORIENTATION=-
MPPAPPSPDMHVGATYRKQDTRDDVSPRSSLGLSPSARSSSNAHMMQRQVSVKPPKSPNNHTTSQNKATVQKHDPAHRNKDHRQHRKNQPENSEIMRGAEVLRNQLKQKKDDKVVRGAHLLRAQLLAVRNEIIPNTIQTHHEEKTEYSAVDESHDAASILASLEPSPKANASIGKHTKSSTRVSMTVQRSRKAAPVGDLLKKVRNSHNASAIMKPEIRQLPSNELAVLSPSCTAPFNPNSKPSIVESLAEQLTCSFMFVASEDLDCDTPVQDHIYLHAQKAGMLWQCLVGQQVKFPSHWYNGERAPRMGATVKGKCPWLYIPQQGIRGNERLNAAVRRKKSPGKILLHIIVNHKVTWKPVEDIVIGCYHPNARGIRGTPNVIEGMKDVRVLWMAVRRRNYSAEESNGRPPVTLIDNFLTQGRSIDKISCDSPLGTRHSINNTNINAIFGATPPEGTICILESELSNKVDKPKGNQTCPALLLLEEFVFRHSE